MIAKFLTQMFGSKNERELKKLQPIVEAINTLEPEIKAMSEARLKDQTSRLKTRFDNGESMDDLLPEAAGTRVVPNQ